MLTLLLGLCDCGAFGDNYGDHRMGFEYGGYGLNQCRFEPGIGEILAEKFGDILKELKG